MDASGGYDALITDGVNGSPYEPPGRTGRRSQAQHRPVGGRGALGQLHAGGLGNGKIKGMISIAESSFFGNSITVTLDFPKQPKTGAVKDVESFREGHHTLRSSPRGVVRHRRASGAVVVAIVLPSSLRETTTWNSKAEICFSDILSCLSGCIDHLLDANRCMNQARLYTLRAWFVAVLIAVIKAGVVVTIMDRDQQRDGEFIWVTC